MSKPFYLACPCGGEWRWTRIAGYPIADCTKCQNDHKDLIELYAAALGLAVEALMKIRMAGFDSDRRIAAKALEQIRSEEKANG